MKNWWEEEHYGLDGSTNSAGIHKLGSGRAHRDVNSNLSNPTADHIGTFFWATDTGPSGHGKLFICDSTSSWSLVGEYLKGSAGTWSALQEFTSEISVSGATITTAVGGERLGPTRTLYGPWIVENITSSTSHVCTRSDATQAFEEVQIHRVVRSGNITGIHATVGGAAIAAGTIEIEFSVSGTMSSLSTKLTSSSPGGTSQYTSHFTNAAYPVVPGDQLQVYAYGDGSLSPSGSIDGRYIMLEVTSTE